MALPSTRLPQCTALHCRVLGLLGSPLELKCILWAPLNTDAELEHWHTCTSFSHGGCTRKTPADDSVEIGKAAARPHPSVCARTRRLAREYVSAGVCRYWPRLHRARVFFLHYRGVEQTTGEFLSFFFCAVSQPAQGRGCLIFCWLARDRWLRSSVDSQISKQTPNSEQSTK